MSDAGHAFDTIDVQKKNGKWFMLVREPYNIANTEYHAEKGVPKFVDRRADKARRHAKPVRASAHTRIEDTAKKSYDKTEHANNAHYRKDLHTPVF